MPFTKRFEIERPTSPFHQPELVRDCRSVEHGISCRKRGQVERLPLNRFTVLVDKSHLAGGKIAGPGEVSATTNRPGQRRGVERERFFDLVEQLERVPAFAVHFVDERNDWYVAQPAYFEKLARARLDALRGVYDHHGRINRG